jgi:hypothetical protein
MIIFGALIKEVVKGFFSPKSLFLSMWQDDVKRLLELFL